MSENRKTLQLKYLKSSNHQSFTAHGVWGGTNGQGEVICNFFTEMLAMPESIEIIQNTETGVVEEKHIASSYLGERMIQSTVIMNPEIAKSIGEWLIEKANQLIQQHKPDQNPTVN